MSKQRCAWANSDPLYIDYHDHEWGNPIHNNQQLFAMLCLEGMQAGLSWITILKKRETYRQAFYNFDPYKIQHMTEQQVDQLMQNKGIIRHRGKIQAIIGNAKAYIQLEQSGMNFSDWLWQVVNHQTVYNTFHTLEDMPTQTEASQHLSKQLKKAGFKFVGPTICYAFMQACGMVHDHTTNCFLHKK